MSETVRKFYFIFIFLRKKDKKSLTPDKSLVILTMYKRTQSELVSQQITIHIILHLAKAPVLQSYKEQYILKSILTSTSLCLCILWGIQRMHRSLYQRTEETYYSTLCWASPGLDIHEREFSCHSSLCTCFSNSEKKTKKEKRNSTFLNP